MRGGEGVQINKKYSARHCRVQKYQLDWTVFFKLFTLTCVRFSPNCAEALFLKIRTANVINIKKITEQRFPLQNKKNLRNEGHPARYVRTFTCGLAANILYPWILTFDDLVYSFSKIIIHWVIGEKISWL